MHKVNMIRNDKKMYNTQKMTQYEKHVRPLEQVERDITLLQSKLVEVNLNLLNRLTHESTPSP